MLALQSVRENRQLSKQLDTWKRQLAAFDGGADANVDYDDDDEDVVLRIQEQAYRSMAAMQLRVEELTLEVTKVFFATTFFGLQYFSVVTSQIRYFMH
jgi:tRNA U34 5-carboxymethylaminomethyl modifying GTPase MnmE/TrmE